MSRSWRIAALVSVGTLALAWVALQQGRVTRANQVLRVLPNTALAVVHIDFRALRASPAAQTLFAALLPEGELSGIEATCDLDPVSDLDEITIWVRGERDTLESFGAMLTGSRVDATRLAECHRLLVEARGSTVIRLEAPVGPLIASDDRRSAVSLVDSRTIVTGSVETVAEAVAARRGLLPTLGERRTFARQWPELSPEAVLRAVVEPPPNWKEALRRSSIEGDPAMLDGVGAIGLCVRREAAEAELLIDAASALRASEIGEGLDQWRSSPPPGIRGPWDAVLQSMEWTVTDRRVRVTANLASLTDPR